MRKSTTHEYEAVRLTGRGVLEGNERIQDICGGPFHTVVLTSKGRLFYSGNFYRTDSLLTDECSTEFIHLNTGSLGKVASIRAYLTGVCMLTLESRLYLLGHFGAHVFDEPHLLSSTSVTSFDVNDQGVYVTND